MLVAPVAALWLVVLTGSTAWAAGRADAAPWAWPLVGVHEVSRPFTLPASRYGSGHRGADLPGAPGSVVRAAGAGRVSYAGLLAGRGVVVVVHGALRTTYEPVTAQVPVGAQVALGEALGLLDAGHPGCPALACLHWGLRRGEAYLDPVRLVDTGPVRLLPLEAGSTGLTTGTGTRGARAVIESGSGPAVLERVEVPAVLPASPGRAASKPKDVDPGPVRAGAPAPADDLVPQHLALGVIAVASLVTGVGLLARPRSKPGAPAPLGRPGAAAQTGDFPRTAPVLDLAGERLRRRLAQGRFAAGPASAPTDDG